MADYVPLTSAMRANLLSLQESSNLMDRTQLRLSTGKAVNSVIDDPARYFTAEGLLQRGSLLGNRKADIGNAIQAINAANNGIKGIKTSIEQLRSIVTQARNTVGDNTTEGLATRASLASQYSEVLTQIQNLVKDSSFNGVNFLKADTQLRVVFNELGDSYLNLSGFDATAYGLEIAGSGGRVPVRTSVADPFSGTTYESHTLTLGANDTVKVDTATDKRTIVFDGVTIEYYGGDSGGALDGNLLVTDIDGNKTTVVGGSAYSQTLTTSSGMQISIAKTVADALTVTYPAGTPVAGQVVVSATVAADSTTTVAVSGTTTETWTLYSNAATAPAGGDVTNPVNVAAFGAAIAGGDLDTLDKLTAIETTLNRALSTLQDKSSQFAGSIGILQTRDDYLKDLINTHRTGADNLTKADMNEEAANMLALQTRQQLGLSSLSIASQALQGVLRLFG